MRKTALIALAAACLPCSATAEDAKEPLAPFAWMDGRWRGEARVLTRKGPITITQTERSGEALGGRIRIVEGKGYNPDGSIGFNAIGIIAPSEDGGFEMRSWTLDATGSFPIMLTDDGYEWQIPAGPGAVVRYSATYDGETWTETGHLIAEGRAPTETFHMAIKRIDHTDWPAAGALGPK